MSFNVGKPKESMRFKPHFNTAMGKMIHTKDDYLKEMKEKNYVPYDPSIDGGKRKEYKIGKDTEQVLRAIKSQSTGENFNPSGALKEELHRRGVLKTQEDLHKYKRSIEEKTGRKFK